MSRINKIDTSILRLCLVFFQPIAVITFKCWSFIQ